METREENPKSNRFKATLDKIKADFNHIGDLAKQIAQDDPRKVVHSFKVGLAITLVSLFYYFDPLYKGFGVNAMWAVLTVVVVFEYSVGATLGKGVNRVLATTIGGMCGVGANRLSSLSVEKVEPILLGFAVFITASVATFMRFFPKIKARFDYGMLIFILTFSLICVSGYRQDEVLDMAHRRISTIFIGSSAAVIVCVLIWPVWAGTDLHMLTASNIQKLGNFFQDIGEEYFKKSADTISNDTSKAFLNRLKNVMDSKNNIDSLLIFARWEPRHGRFRYRHPWTQYQKIGQVTRNCACRAEALLGFIHSHIQAPNEVKAKFQDSCIKMSIESGKALTELSTAITKMTQPSKAKPYIKIAKEAAQNLNLLLRSNIWRNLNLSDVTPTATVASLLADVVASIEEIEKGVQELASLAKFKNVSDSKVAPEVDRSKLAKIASVKRRSFNTHVVVIDGSTPCSTPRFEDPPSLAMAHQSAE